MDTPRTRFKLGEAKFFLSHLQRIRREPTGDSAREFAYYLSAFLGGVYSVMQLLEREVKTALKKGATNKRQAKGQYDRWTEQWRNRLPTDELAIWNLMEGQRHLEVHDYGAETVAETKAIPIRPRLFHGGIYGPIVTGPPAIYADQWLEEKRKLGLPSWADAWWEAQVHHFEVAGERQEVVTVCERYLALLERLLDDFHGSELASSVQQ